VIKLSDYVISFLADRGVRHIFFVPGGAAMHLNDSLGQCGRIEYVCNLHEQASAIGAEAYGKITNNIGVAMVTAGPGGTNAITGVAGAWLDSTPMLVISGQAKRPDLKRDLGVRQLGLQEVDIVSLVKPITKYAVMVDDPSTIRYHLEQAIFLAKTGRPGPVWIDIPLDVQAAVIDEPATLKGFDLPAPAPVDAPTSLVEQVRRAAVLFNQAQRPVLLAGNGIRLAGANAEFLALAQLLGWPVLTTWLALDLIGEDHPLFAGRPGAVAPRGPNFTLQNSDLLLTIGARLDLVLTAYAPGNLARGAKKIMVDIDPAEIRKMPRLNLKIDLPIAADAQAFLKEVLRQRDAIKKHDRRSWLARAIDWKARYPVVRPEHRNPQSLVSVYHLSEILSEELTPGDLIVSGSSGAGIEIFLLAFKIKMGQRIVHTTALGAMGYGPPAAIGGCLAGGRRRTVCVDGDGGIQLNIQEFATIARLKLPIKFFILNNDGFASIRTSQRNWFAGRLVGADKTSGLLLPDIRKVAAAYGLPVAHIANQSSLREQVKEVLHAPGPIVCEVMVQPDEDRLPRTSSMQKADGSMVSTPLEDLYPFLDREEFKANMITPSPG
jgi:acetolactate synthase-1/2/3 large subunit